MNGRYWFVISVLLLILAGSWATVNLGDDIVPIVNDFFNLGSLAKRINYLYAVDVDTNNLLVGKNITHDDGTASDFTISSSDQDKDILLKINDGGTTRTAIQVNGDEGSVTMPRQSYVFAYMSGNQTIANNTETTLAFASEATDTLGEFDTGTYIFTAKDAGIYVVSLGVLWTNTNSGVVYYLKVIASEGTWSHRLNGDGQTYTPSIISMPIKLSAGGTIKGSVLQSSGGDETIYGSENVYTFLKITKVS